MHRYTAAPAGSGTGNNREASARHANSGSSFGNDSQGLSVRRRTVQLTSYKLKCEKEALSPRLGPPDYYPPAPNCAEELLTRETCQHGYKEAIDGLEEGRETACTLIGNGSSALWTKDNINRYKESLRKRLRAVTNALIRRRKAGQVYDVPLQGQLLAKPGFPERQTCGEDFRRKWLEDLSQRKRLASLAEHVPHGFHKRTLFEALVKQNVPFLRATWFIKVLYLNQVRLQLLENSAGVSEEWSKEQWTKDLLEYAQLVLDELCQNSRYQAGEPCHGYDGVEPDAQVKWNYLVRLLQWQYAEGLIQQSQVVDWALKQIQEKDSLEKLERVLPLLLKSMDLLALSQVHVRMLVYISLDWLRQLGASTSLPDNPQHHQVAATLVELLRYLLVAVPDTFVAFDCFPLPPCIFTLEGSGTAKEELKSLSSDAQKATTSAASSPYREAFVAEVVDSIQKRACLLTKAVNPGVLRSNEGKVIQLLDRSVVSGDVCCAYSVIFDGGFSGYEQLPAEWKEISSSPFLSGIMNNVNLSDLFAVRFICEWAICDFRDTRQKVNRAEKKLAGTKDMSRVYMAVSVICMRKSELESSLSSRVKKSKSSKTGSAKTKSKGTSTVRGSMHDIIVAWIDQHELRKGDGLLRMQLLLSELVRKGIFHPETYVRQLIVEGVLEKRESQADITRASRHRHALRFLPGPANIDLVEELKDSDDIPENVRMYRNERRLALQGFSSYKKLQKVQLSKDSAEKVTLLVKETAKMMTLVELKQAVSAYLHLPDGGMQQKLGTSTVLKRSAPEVTPGCEECLRNKRQKIGEGRGSALLAPTEAEDTWWLKKVSKVSDPVIKSEISVKPPKQAVRGRPKTARKTQSLAHLQRIDGSQGASSSHTCDSRMQCPHHRSANKIQLNESKAALRCDLRSIGSSIRQLRFPEKYAFSSWINRTVRAFLSRGAVAGNPATEVRWCLTEERFSAVVYMLDAALDFQSLLRLLLWLLPGKSAPNKDIGEGTIVSCLRRYENMLTTMNLLPEVLSVLMQCASAMGSGLAGRAGCSLLLSYVRELLRKYVSLPTVQTWERNWKVSCDQKVALEFEALKAAESDSGLGYMGVFGSSVGDEREDPVPQRLNSRVAKSIGSGMRDIVQRGMGDDIVGDRMEENAHRVAAGLLDGIKQHGSVQADTTAINAAVSAIVNNASSSAAVFCEGLSNVTTVGPDSSSARATRRVLQAHTQCLRLVKEGLDDRQSRVLEAALATEASTIVGGLFVQSSGRAPRSQFHLSPETPELGTLGDYGGPGSTATTTTTTNSSRAAAATALVALAAIQGVVSLERMISVLKIRDNLEPLQLPKLLFSSSNGLSRGPSVTSNIKSDSMVELHIYWFRALVGDCRTVSNGLLAEILGESNVVALCRAQRLLPLNVVFTMAYSMFCGLLRRKVLSHMHITSKDDGIVQSLTAATKEIVAHEPFRESCLQDTRALYGQLLTDIGSSVYAAMLDAQALDTRSKVDAMLPFAARLFLYALLDKRLPSSMEWQDEEAWLNGSFGFEHSRQVEQIVRILDEIQPATFHWQWLELRLLLHEQAFVEKIEAQSSAAKAVQAVAADSVQLSECEKSFAEMVLTRLLCRPDAAALYSEVLNCVGTCKPKQAGDRPLEDYLIMLVKWVLKGEDVLLGRKSLRQLLESYAHTKKFSIRMTSSVKSWCWQPLVSSSAESVSLEEGEVQISDASRSLSPPWEETAEHFITEKALANLVLPCLARSPNETCSSFASDLVTQMTELEQQVTLLTKTATARPPNAGMPGGPVSKIQGSRRGARTGLEAGSPAVRRRQAEPLPLAAALQSSIWMRLQFLLPLLRIIYSDRDPTAGRNMRLTLAPILLRLLGTRIVQEPAESFHSPASGSSGGSGREAHWNAELPSLAATAAAGEELFDRLLSVLHALMSNTWAIWLKPRASPKAPGKHKREVPPFDRDTAERMQTELDHMQLLRSTRMRLQAAMPVFPPQTTPTVAAAPPQVPLSSFNMLQATLTTNSKLAEQQQRSAAKTSSSVASTSVSGGLEAEAMAMDPWTLLEDGTGMSTTTTAAGTGTTAVSLVSSAGTDPTLRACPWLRGAVRVRRTDLTYVGSVDSADT